MAASSCSGGNTQDHSFLDEPLIALTERCGGDLQKVMAAIFSFLHRRTDFYFVPQDEDLKQGKAKMGFKQGDAEKILLASFRQFPLRRMPLQDPRTKQNASASNTTEAATVDTKVNASSSTSKALTEIRLTEKGLQIPVGNGGTTQRYKWTQTLEECSVIIPIPGDGSIRAKDLNVEIKASSILVEIRQPLETRVLVEGELEESVVPDESTWTMEGGVLVLALFKKKKTFWTTIIMGDEKIDASMVDSRRNIRDYDESTQAQIRKIIHQQQQSAISPAKLAAAQPLTPELLPPGAEYIDPAKIDSISRKNDT